MPSPPDSVGEACFQAVRPSRSSVRLFVLLVGLVQGWLGDYSGLFTHISGQLQVERRTGKVRRPKTDVLPVCHTTNGYSKSGLCMLRNYLTARSTTELYKWYK